CGPRDQATVVVVRTRWGAVHEPRRRVGPTKEGGHVCLVPTVPGRSTLQTLTSPPQPCSVEGRGGLPPLPPRAASGLGCLGPLSARRVWRRQGDFDPDSGSLAARTGDF